MARVAARDITGAKAAGAARRRMRAYEKCLDASGPPTAQARTLRTEVIFHPMEP